MPKPSSLTLSLSQEQAGGQTTALYDDDDEDALVHSPIRATGGLAPNEQGSIDGDASSKLARELPPSRGLLEPPGSPRTYSTGTKARKPVPGARAIPSAMSSNNLDPPPPLLHPYRNSPGSSIASMSHGNLLETASIASGSVGESLDTSEMTESETGFKSHSLPRVDGEHNLRPSRKPNKQVFQQIMSRSRSIRQDNNSHSNGRNVHRLNTRGRFFDSSRSRERSAQESPRTAPLEPDRGYREAMNAKIRNRSADRLANSANDANDQHRPTTSRLANLVTSSSKAAGDLGRVGKGLFGKFSRRGSSQEREVPPVIVDENHQINLINLPLVEQTRKTRIRQRMSEAKDKTEFWLPALPYRCIDYLNLKGCEVEGLYRVPGSVREIKHWQIRFDTELDVNLLDVHDLDDVNTIGSLLKAWLRDQPDELIPHDIQKKIAVECADAPANETPQFFKDELSKLPPFNYYLLFAITAHLALLQKHSDVNKMDYRNLCICFQPCMNLDPIAFQFLVKDWRNCWQGCWPEKEFLEEEYRVMRGDPPSLGQGLDLAALTLLADEHIEPPKPVRFDWQAHKARSEASGSPHRGRTKVLPVREVDEPEEEASTDDAMRRPAATPAPHSSPQLPTSAAT